MRFTSPTVITDDLLAALEDDAADVYLNRRTGEIVRLFPGDEWREQDDADDAREDMAARPGDWLRLPHGEWTDVARWLVRQGVYPTLA